MISTIKTDSDWASQMNTLRQSLMFYRKEYDQIKRIVETGVPSDSIMRTADEIYLRYTKGLELEQELLKWWFENHQSKPA